MLLVLFDDTASNAVACITSWLASIVVSTAMHDKG